MKSLDKMICHISEELDGAVEYAEDYVGEKMKNNAAKASKFREMALQELTHAQNWYEWAEKHKEEIEKIMPLSVSDDEEWQHCRKLYAERVAIAKYMLDR